MSKITRSLEDIVLDDLPDIGDLFVDIANSDELTYEIAWAVRDLVEEQYRYMMRKLRKIEKASGSIKL